MTAIKVLNVLAWKYAVMRRGTKREDSNKWCIVIAKNKHEAKKTAAPYFEAKARELVTETIGYLYLDKKGRLRAVWYTHLPNNDCTLMDNQYERKINGTAGGKIAVGTWKRGSKLRGGDPEAAKETPAGEQSGTLNEKQTTQKA